MEIVAQVFNRKITRTELQFEENCLKHQYPEAGLPEIRNFAMTQLIDRYILLEEAANRGISANDDEIDHAMMEMLDEPESTESSLLVDCRDMGEQLERYLKNNIIIQKYIAGLEIKTTEVTDDRLLQFYHDHQDFFCKDMEVHAFQFLSKGIGPESQERINKLRDKLNTPEEFMQFHNSGKDVESDLTFGDLGYFPQGRMIPKLEKIAFALGRNEVSQPFKTKFGYHIIIVTDIRDKHIVPFDAIKEGLKESLVEMEEELAIARMLSDIRERSRIHIKIFETNVL